MGKKGGEASPEEPGPLRAAEEATLLGLSRDAASGGLAKANALLDDAEVFAAGVARENRELDAALGEAREEMQDLYFFLQQKLDNNYDHIVGLERRVVLHRVELEIDEKRFCQRRDAAARDHVLLMHSLRDQEAAALEALTQAQAAHSTEPGAAGDGRAAAAAKDAAAKDAAAHDDTFASPGASPSSAQPRRRLEMPVASPSGAEPWRRLETPMSSPSSAQPRWRLETPASPSGSQPWRRLETPVSSPSGAQPWRRLETPTSPGGASADDFFQRPLSGEVVDDVETYEYGRGDAAERSAAARAKADLEAACADAEADLELRVASSGRDRVRHTARLKQELRQRADAEAALTRDCGQSGTLLQLVAASHEAAGDALATSARRANAIVADHVKLVATLAHLERDLALSKETCCIVLERASKAAPQRQASAKTLDDRQRRPPLPPSPSTTKAPLQPPLKAVRWRAVDEMRGDEVRVGPARQTAASLQRSARRVRGESGALAVRVEELEAAGHRMALTLDCAAAVLAKALDDARHDRGDADAARLAGDAGRDDAAYLVQRHARLGEWPARLAEADADDVPDFVHRLARSAHALRVDVRQIVGQNAAHRRAKVVH